jgi:hypothetical protein
MPIYIRFLQNGVPISDTARSGAHTPEWTNFKGADPGRARAAIPEVDDEVLVGFVVSDRPSASLGSWAKVQGLDVTWDVPSYAPKKLGRATLVAQIEFTPPDRGGGEIADLRVQLHDVRIVRSEHTLQAGRITPVERMLIACSKMTLLGAPKSAPDISHQVRARAGGSEFP